MCNGSFLFGTVVEQIICKIVIAVSYNNNNVGDWLVVFLANINSWLELFFFLWNRFNICDRFYFEQKYAVFKIKMNFL